MKRLRPLSLGIALATATSVLAVAEVAATSPSLVSAAVSGPACTRDYYASSSTTKVFDATFSADRRPVVYVHGYNSSSGSWTGGNNPASILERQTDGRIQNFLYDYGRDSQRWASNDKIAACLGQYITEVGKAWKQKGGDGKVLVVAHSMGGLATLYAISPEFAEQPAGDYVGGIVTFDTPYLGSGWGNNDSFTRGMAGIQALRDAQSFPAPDTAAGFCLAPHKGGEPLPSPCSEPLPPQLPTSIGLTTIAGNISVQRKVLGVPLYNLPLNSDGIVSVESSNGYRKMYSPPVGGSNVTVKDVEKCSITTGDVWDAAQQLGGPFRAAGTFAGSLYDLSSDGWSLALHAFDGNGTVGADRSGDLNLYATMAIANLKASCSHINITHNQSALNKATEALKEYLDELGSKSGSLFLNTKLECEAGSRLVLVAKTEHGEAGQCVSNTGGIGHLVVYSGNYKNGEPQLVYAQEIPLVGDNTLYAVDEGHQLYLGAVEVVYMEFGQELIRDKVLSMASEDG